MNETMNDYIQISLNSIGISIIYDIKRGDRGVPTGWGGGEWGVTPPPLGPLP